MSRDHTLWQQCLDWWRHANPYGRLEVTAQSPHPHQLIFHRQWGGRFRLSSQPHQVFKVTSLITNPPLPHLEERASRGAVIGAGAASMRGRDVLKGAIIGDWLGQQLPPPSNQVHRLDLVLTNTATGEDLSLSFSLTADACKTLYRYFK